LIAPKSAREAPKREKLLRDNDEPSSAKPNTDIVDPNRDAPKMDKADPKRAMLRRAIEEPKDAKSHTAKEDPNARVE
jgi:hypothetical protein